MIPPSPWLLARRISATYFSETTIISVQKIAETPPMTLAAVSGIPYSGLKVSFAAYSGLVPMSPYTTPNASSANAAVDCRGGACPASAPIARRPSVIVSIATA